MRTISGNGTTTFKLSYSHHQIQNRSLTMVFGNLFISRHEWDNVESNKMSDEVPEVEEVGATSAPLLSAAYFIGARCKPYNDDFMLCKDEKNGGTVECLKEGRRVTRCAVQVLKDINTHCFDEFKLHYECLEQENHRLGSCRKTEKIFNSCVFDKLKLEKKIPGVETQIFQKENPIYKGTGYDKKAAAEFKSKAEAPAVPVNAPANA